MSVQKLFHKHRSFLSILFLVLIVAWIGVSAYQPNTWLTGWDNLHPEFDFWLNIKRGLSSAWKNFQGLGAVSGIALSSELPHQLLTWVMSLFFARHQIRFVWTLGMLLFGSVGMYAVLKRHFFAGQTKYQQLGATIGSLFYLLNFGTIQQFYTPYEAFIAQYAFFPWVVFVTLHYLAKPSNGRLFWVVMAALLIMPIAYVPTVFIVTMLALGIFLISHLSKTAQKKTAFTHIALLIGVFFAINLHWLMPFSYYVITKGDSTAQSKINQFASNDARLSNNEYGRWSDIVVLRGFWFEYLDTPVQSQPQYLMQPWRVHFNNPFIWVLGISFFAIVLVGIFAAIKEKLPYRWPLIGLFGIAIFMLKSYNPPFGLVFRLLSDYVPLFGEIFRYTFTKWVGVAIFCYSALFAFGIIWLVGTAAKLLRIKRVRWNAILQTVSLSIVFLSLVIYMLPVFAGQLFSTANQLKIPDEYFSVMQYFRTQPKFARIATLPQYSFWGWDVHTWKYRGSGWWRHGIEQPLLERTHDVWAKENEQYYTELSNAIYTENVDSFAAVVKKYQVGWLLIDHTLDYSRDKQLPQIKGLADASGLFEKPVVFGQLTIYPRKDLTQIAQSYVSSQPTIFTSPNYQPWDKDTVYELAGSYIPVEPAMVTPIFDKQSLVNLKRSEQEVTYTQDLSLVAGAQLNLPDYFSEETIVPAKLFARRDQDNLTIKITPQLPSLLVDSRVINLPNQEKEITFSVPRDLTEIGMKLNQFAPIILSSLDQNYKEISQNYLFTQIPNEIFLFDRQAVNEIDLSDQFLNANAQECEDYKGKVSKDRYEGNAFTLNAQKTLGCAIVTVPNLDRKNLTEVTIESRSQTTERPLIIIKDDLTEEILNPEFPTTTEFNPEWSAQRGWANPSQNAQFDTSAFEVAMALNAVDTLEPRQIAYRNIQLRQFPVVSQDTFSFANVTTAPPPAQTVTLDQSATKITVKMSVLPMAPAGLYTSATRKYMEQTKNCDLTNDGKHDKTFRPEGIEYFARNASECDAWNFAQSASNSNYLLETTSRHQAGKPLQVCLSYSVTGRCDVMSLLPDSSDWQTVFFPVLAKPTPGGSYVVQINNHSIGREETINSLQSLNLYPFPLGWLEGVVANYQVKPLAATKIIKATSSHSSLHFVEIEKPKEPSILSLSQTYDKGWLLFQISKNQWNTFPLLEQFGIGQQIGKHYRQDSWQNGWLIEPDDFRQNSDQNAILVMVFWPFALQMVGWFAFVSMLIFCLVIAINHVSDWLKHRFSKK